MKIHFFIFSFILFTGCGLFSQKDKNKEKAKELLLEITTRHSEIKPQLEQLISLRNNLTQDSLSKEEIEILTIGNSVKGEYKNWKKDFDKFQQQAIYMNYDLQMMRLEKLEEKLNQLEQLIAKRK